MSKFRALLIAVWIALLGVLAGAQSASSSPQELTAFQQSVLSQMEQLFAAAAEFEDDEVRLVFRAQVADALWDYDEPQARRMFEDAFAGVSSARKRGPRRSDQGDLVNEALSILSQFELRSEILRLISRRDAGFANRLAQSAENPRTEATERTALDRLNDADHTELYLQMARSAAEIDPQRAVQLAKQALDRGIISPLLLDVIEAIRAEKPALADGLFSFALSVAGRDGAALSRNVALLAGYVFPDFGGGIRLGSTPDLAINSSASWAATAQFLDFAHGAALQQTAPRMPRVAGAVGGSGRMMDPQNMVALQALEQLVPYFDQFMPEKSSDVRTRRDEALERMAPEQRELIAKPSQPASAGELLSQAATAPAGMARDGLYVQAANAAAREGDADEALSIAARITHAQLKSAIASTVRHQASRAALRENDVETAYRFIADSPDLGQRAGVIAQIVGWLAGKENISRAMEILRDAGERLAKATHGPDRVHALLTMAGIAARLDPNGGFDLMRSAVDSINRVEIAPQWSDENQQAGSDSKGAKVLAGLRRLNFDDAFPILARADFERALGLAREIRMTEALSLAQLSVCRGALSRPRELQTDPGEVLAIVNGTKITSTAIDGPIAQQFSDLHESLAGSRRRELDRQIHSRLRKVEAQRRGISLRKLVDIEIFSTLKNPAQAADELDRTLRQSARIEVLVKEISPPETLADRARVLTRVNGEPITAAEVEDALRPITFNTQQRIHQLRATALESKIDQVLLQQEAERRGTITQTLIESDRAGGALARRLRQGASVEIFLEPPRPPVYSIATDDQPAKGNPRAPITIVTFTDYQSPASARLHLLLERFIDENQDNVQLVVRDFPIETSVDAFKAAEAAEAAREQAKYWEYVALLYQNQAGLTRDKLEEYARRLGLDRERFGAALDSERFAGYIERDIDDARTYGVGATPVVFVNGRRLDENGLADLGAILKLVAARGRN